MQVADVQWQSAQWAELLPVVAGVSVTSSPLCAEGFNIAKHVGDEVHRVEENRAALQRAVGLENDWLWLNQVHSAVVVDDDSYKLGVSADAVISRNPQKTAVVMTADCVPVLLTNRAGTEVAAIHAGWPGLHQRIISATLAEMRSTRAEIFAWIGPCAGREKYEVDEAFHQRFVEQDARYTIFFRENRVGHYLADLVGMARFELVQGGVPVTQISGGTDCSISHACYFSHRRDGAASGRMASFIAPKG